MLSPVAFSPPSEFDVFAFIINFPFSHRPSQPPYIRDDPFSRVLLNLLGHRGGACAGHEREHDECGEDGVPEDGHEDDDQHDVQYHADEVSRLVHVFSEQMDSHADQQDYERESGQQENQYQGFPAVAKARSIRDPFMTSYWECSQCL